MKGSAALRPDSPDIDGSGTVLEARGVSVHFGGIFALSNVSLAVSRGKLVGLMGPNGAGKTTLFEVLSGRRRPDVGSVYFFGQDMSSASPQARARMGLARTFQHPQLFGSLTIAEHLMLGHRLRHEPLRLWTDLLTGKAWRKPNRSECEHVETILELFGLDEIANHTTAGLPTGLARLVQVALGLAASPRILLLDEPAAGLSNHETRELLEALKRAVALDGTAMLVIEHDLDFLLGMAEIIHVMDAGCVIASGSPEEIRANTAVQSAYLGTDDSR